MRKTLFATAAFAALAIAGAASAQTVNLGPLSQQNFRPQTANLTVNNGLVGAALTGGATAVGNLITTDAAITTHTDFEQANFGGQTANVNLNGGSFGDSRVSGQAIGNAISVEGSYSGSMPMFDNNQKGQDNGAAQVSNVALNGGTFRGNLGLSSVAVGNNLSIDGSAAFLNRSDPNAANGNLQFNSGTQTANLTVTGGAINGDGNLIAQAVGNALSVDGSASVSALNVRNNGTQTANATIVNGQFNGLTVGASAIGNLSSFTTAAGVQSLGGLYQHNEGTAQISNTLISNGNFGSLAASATSIGNALSVARP